MDNKRAFTLIELLAVLVVLGIIGLIAVPVVNKTVLNSRKKLYDIQIDGIVKAAEEWAANNFRDLPSEEENSITITLGQLKLSGIIKEDVKNPITEEVFPNDMEIEITYRLNNYVYEVKTDTGTTGELDPTLIIMILNGRTHEYVEINTEYVEKGIVAKDPTGKTITDIDIAIKSNLEIVGEIDTTRLGQYTITYSAEYEGKTTSIIRTVTVRDTISPILTLSGSKQVKLSEVENYNLLNLVTTSDNSLKEVRVEVEGSLVSIPGIYKITYKAIDQSNNEASKNMFITVVDDIPPVITFTPNGNGTYAKIHNVKVNVKDLYGEVKTRYYVWSNTTDEPAKESINQVFNENETISTPAGLTGTYYLWVRSTDNNNNEIITRSNDFNLDNIPPVITVPDNTVLKINEVSGYNLRTGVSVTDNNGGSLDFIVEGSLSKIAGSYIITYRAVDSSGNVGTETRVIDVIDIEAPIITIIGSSNININAGTTYTDQGATAVDDADGNVTNKIIVTNPVNTNVPGIYYITYKVKDSSNNESTATRTVRVIDNVAPTVTFGTNGNSTYAKSRSTTVLVTDQHGTVVNRYYQWTTSATAPTSSSFVQTFTNGVTITTPAGVSGSYYLWIKGIDNANNEVITRSNVFNLDNTPPNISGITINSENITHNSFMITINGDASDTHSGLAINPYIYRIQPDNGGNSVIVCTNNSRTCNATSLAYDERYFYSICVNDVAGNQSCLSSKITRTLFTITTIANKPVLTSGMTPIKWNGTAWVNTVQTDDDWYDYANKRWANVRTADGSYWVWIPRYAYRIASGYNSETAGTINIKFLQQKTNNVGDGTMVRTSGYVSGTNDSTMEDYFVHPAFTFGTEEISGFWVAKFEPSGSLNTINIVPNVSSLRSKTIGEQFTAAYNMRNNSRYGWTTNAIDTHMMKNSEWGAVAYLSHSLFGANTEVWKNPNSNYITGCSGVTPNASSTNQCQEYDTPNGQKSSTTHNITGVYDMNGGAGEYVAAYLNAGHTNLTTYGNSIVSAEAKYQDIYIAASDADDSSSNHYITNGNKYGDAVVETSLDTSGLSAWYGGWAEMPVSSTPFFIRGNHYDSSGASVFSFNSNDGDSDSDYTFRPVVIIK